MSSVTGTQYISGTIPLLFPIPVTVPVMGISSLYVHRPKACNDATMAFEVGGRLLKTRDDLAYPRAFDQPFTFTVFPK